MDEFFRKNFQEDNYIQELILPIFTIAKKTERKRVQIK
jgi:hypothetical protein